jgi:hypothetical protein
MDEMLEKGTDPFVREDLHERARCLAREAVLSRIATLEDWRCVVETMGEGLVDRFAKPAGEISGLAGDYFLHLGGIAGKVIHSAKLAWDEATEPVPKTEGKPETEPEMEAEAATSGGFGPRVRGTLDFARERASLAASHAGRIAPEAGTEAMDATREFLRRMGEVAPRAGHEWMDAGREMGGRVLVAVSGALTGFGEALRHRAAH